MDLIAEQLRLEDAGREAGIARFEAELERSDMSGTPGGSAVIRAAVGLAAPAIYDYLMEPRPGRGGVYRAWYNNLNLSPELIAYTGLRTLVMGISCGWTAASIYKATYTALVDEANYQEFRREAPAYLKAVESNIYCRSANSPVRKRVLNRAAEKIGLKLDFRLPIDEYKATAYLVELLIERTGIAERVYRTQHFQFAPAVAEKIAAIHGGMADYSPILYPMVAEPKDWTGMYGGGYYTHRIPLVRMKARHQAVGLSDDLLKAVNNIQRTAWRINKPVLDVLEELVRRNSTDANLYAETPMPERPWLSKEEYERIKIEQPEVYKEYRARAWEMHRKEARERSPRRIQQIAMEMARKFADYEKLWFVWTLDWRGRIYPLTPMLNPQGEDYCKALLEFADGVALGERGAYWLAIHLANTHGEDKLSFDERYAWTMEHEQDILEAAANPLANHWWREADSPWKFLAACLEWAGYRREGLSFVSHLPIAQDGTCSGLQHYSALLRDPIGGAAVNLVPSTRPNDIYKMVAQAASEIIKEELSESSKALDEEAEVLAGKLASKADSLATEELVAESRATLRRIARVWLEVMDRSVAKRATMTTPYGVTLIGMSEQLKDLVKQGKIVLKGLDSSDYGMACMYLAKRLERAIDRVVVGARAGMEWIQATTQALAAAGVDLRWTTPIGFRTQQPYHKQKSNRLQTRVGTVYVQSMVQLATDSPDGRKSVAGSAPNVIHSLDAAHLMLSVNKMVSLGLSSFALIHDSYGTHAAHTDLLRQVTREQFAVMYSGNILEDIRQQALEQCECALLEVELPPTPAQGSLNVDQVRMSRYMFA